MTEEFSTGVFSSENLFYTKKSASQKHGGGDGGHGLPHH